MASPPVKRNLLFCTDFSEHAETAFTHAIDLAKQLKAKLHLFHVLLPLQPCGNSNSRASESSRPGETVDDSENNLIQQSIGACKLKYDDMLKSALQDYEIIATVGSPDVEIIKYANENNIDMIILGALGIPEKERITRIRTAANVSKFAPCQVMVIQKTIHPDLGI